MVSTGTPAMSRPMTTSATETLDSGRQVGSGATSNWTLTSSDSSARSSRIRPSSTRRRSTAMRMTGSGFGDGCAEASAWSSAATSTACR